MRRLEGRVALVTGGGSGIGRAAAVRLAEEGAAVAVVGRRPAPLAEVVATVEAAGGRACALPADLGEADACARVVEDAVAWGGRLDVVVNNAAAFDWQPLAQVSDDAWARLLDVNLGAPMRVVRSALDALGERGGAVVNVSSVSAMMGEDGGSAPYAAAKAGLEALTRQLAVELAPSGVRVVAVSPGSVRTPPAEAVWGGDLGAWQAWLDRFVPLRRVAEPEEIASVIAFLASDDASYLTGTVVIADGGLSIL